MATVTEHEAQQIDKVNEAGRPPVVFVHGLWLLANSWESWATSFEEAGYTALTPGWPDDPVTVDEAKAHPDAFAGKTIKQIADRYVEVINRLAAKPAVIGHSFGGLLTEDADSPRCRWPLVPRRSAACCQFRSPRSSPRGRSSATRPTATGPCH